VNGICRRKVSRVLEACDVGASCGESALALFGELDAVRVICGARQGIPGRTRPRFAHRPNKSARAPSGKNRRPPGGDRECTQLAMRHQPRRCSVPGSRLRQTGVSVESSVPSSVRECGIESTKRRSGDLEGASRRIGIRETYRVPVTISWFAEIGERHLARTGQHGAKSPSGDCGPGRYCTS
jgi:hypothetical protein